MKLNAFKFNSELEEFLERTEIAFNYFLDYNNRDRLIDNLDSAYNWSQQYFRARDKFKEKYGIDVGSDSKPHSQENYLENLSIGMLPLNLESINQHLFEEYSRLHLANNALIELMKPLKEKQHQLKLAEEADATINRGKK